MGTTSTTWCCRYITTTAIITTLWCPTATFTTTTTWRCRYITTTTLWRPTATFTTTIFCSHTPPPPPPSDVCRLTTTTTWCCPPPPPTTTFTLQIAVIEFARSVLGRVDANSAEFSPACRDPAVVFMPEISTTHLGG